MHKMLSVHCQVQGKLALAVQAPETQCMGLGKGDSLA